MSTRYPLGSLVDLRGACGLPEVESGAVHIRSEVVLRPVDDPWRERSRLFEQQGGVCYWCKKPMELVDRRWYKDGKLGQDECTIDHFYSEWSVSRPGTPKVAAHYACNQLRNSMEVKRIPLDIRKAVSDGRMSMKQARYEIKKRRI